MIDAVMYGMIPNAKTVSRRMLPPANRSKNPKIDPELELKNSSQRVMLMPGVGMWPPSRYTASMASANSSRLRRSGTRNMFVNASNSLFMTPFDFPPLIGLGAKHLRRSAGRLDLLQSRLGKVVGFPRDLARQYAGAECRLLL